MSVEQMAKVWNLDLPHNQAWVLMALADHANDQGWCYPSLGRIAHKTGYSRQTVHAVVVKLVEAGIVEKHPAPGRPSRIQLRLDRAPTKAPYLEREKSGNLSKDLTPTEPVNVSEDLTPPHPEPVANLDTHLSSPGFTGVSSPGFTRTIINHQNNHQDPTGQGASAPDPAVPPKPWDMLTGLAAVLGFDPAKLDPDEKGKQLKIAKRLIERGFLPTDVEHCARWLLSDDYWAGAGIDMGIVSTQIGRWEMNGKPERRESGRAAPSQQRSKVHDVVGRYVNGDTHGQEDARPGDHRVIDVAGRRKADQ